MSRQKKKKKKKKRKNPGLGGGSVELLSESPRRTGEENTYSVFFKCDLMIHKGGKKQHRTMSQLNHQGE